MQKLLYFFFPLLSLVACGNKDLTVVMDQGFSLVFPTDVGQYIRSLDQELPGDINHVILSDENITYLQRSITLSANAIFTVASLLPRIETIIADFAPPKRPTLYYLDFFEEVPQESAIPIPLNRTLAFGEAGEYAAKQIAEDQKEGKTYLFILDNGERSLGELTAFQDAYAQHADSKTLEVRRYQSPVSVDTLRDHVDSSSTKARVLVFAVGPQLVDILPALAPLPSEISIIIDTLLGSRVNLGYIDAEIHFQMEDMIDYVIKHEKGFESMNENRYVEAVFFRYSN